MSKPNGAFRQYLDFMSHSNQPIEKKAQFWISYGAALKGTENMRADDHSRRRLVLRPLPENLRSPKPIPVDESPQNRGHDSLANRIKAPGYVYESLNRETYGYSARQYLQRRIAASKRTINVYRK